MLVGSFFRGKLCEGDGFARAEAFQLARLRRSEGDMLACLDKLFLPSCGGMCERLKQAVLKTALGESPTGVRIPLPPPFCLLSRSLCFDKPETG